MHPGVKLRDPTLVPDGVTVSLELPPGRAAKGARLLESGAAVTGRQTGNRFVVEVPRVQVHEVLAVDLV